VIGRDSRFSWSQTVTWTVDFDNGSIVGRTAFDLTEIGNRSVDTTPVRISIVEGKTVFALLSEGHPGQWKLRLTDPSPYRKPKHGKESYRIFVIGPPLGCCGSFAKSM
jgi:hypothetical protein